MSKLTDLTKLKLNPSVKKYLSAIGRKGGKKSRRVLSPEVAQNMVKLREARKAYRKYHSLCFWSYDPEYKIELKDIYWVGEHLMRFGNRKLWMMGSKLCR